MSASHIPERLQSRKKPSRQEPLGFVVGTIEKARLEVGEERHGLVVSFATESRAIAMPAAKAMHPLRGRRMNGRSRLATHQLPRPIYAAIVLLGTHLTDAVSQLKQRVLFNLPDSRETA